MSFMNDVAQQVISYERWSHEWYLVKPREGGWKVVSLVSIKFVSWIITDSWSSWAIQFVTHTLREKSYHSWWKISFMNGVAQQDISHQNTHSRQTSTSVTSTSITSTWMVVRSEWVTSNIWVISSYEKSCYSYERVVWTSHVAHAPANGCQMRMSHVKYMSHTNIWIRHATRMNELCYPHPRE